jgi:hypothetical protein
MSMKRRLVVLASVLLGIIVLWVIGDRYAPIWITPFDPELKRPWSRRS